MSDLSEKRPDVLDVLSVGPVGVTSPGEVARARENMLPWLEDQVAAVPLQSAQNQQRRRIYRFAAWAGGASAAAAAVALTLLSGAPDRSAPGENHSTIARTPQEDVATLVSGKLSSPSQTWSAGLQVPLTGRMETGQEGAALQAVRGYQLELAPSSAASFEPSRGGEGAQNSGSKIHLHRGKAKLSVLPLPQGARLTVVAGDTLLTVIQSAFTVEVLKGERSCVRVSEGSVAIQRGTQRHILQAGEQSGCAAELPSDPTTAAPTALKKNPTGPRTTLSQENALLARALAAESRGKKSEARSAYEELLTRYPRSSFAQDARAGLTRLSEEDGPEK